MSRSKCLGEDLRCSGQINGNKFVLVCAHCKTQVALMHLEDVDMQVGILAVHKGQEVFKMKESN